MNYDEWQGFKPGAYQNEINVADFIKANYTPYEGEADFLSGATARTKGIMDKVNALLKAEREKGGVLDVDVENVSSLLGFNPGSIDARAFIDTLQLEPSEYELIKYPERGTCLYRCGNERYLLQVIAPEYKSVLFGQAGGR